MKKGGYTPKKTNSAWLAIGYLIACIAVGLMMYVGMHFLSTTDREDIDIVIYNMMERYSGLSSGHNQALENMPGLEDL